MRSRIISTAFLAFLLAGCAGGIDTADLVRVDGVTELDTGLCQTQAPCVQPINAGFTLSQDGNTVLHFRTDADGRFTIRVAPGDYLVKPDPDARLIPQTSELNVPATDSVSVTVMFYTAMT